MKKKKILVFIDWYLPGYKAGGPIQSVANLVDHLKDFFDFSIVTRNTDYCETIPYETIFSNEWNLQIDGTRVYYFSSDQLTRKAINALINEEEFDYVYLNGIYSLYFTLLPLHYLRNKTNKQIIIAARGMLSEGSLGVKSKKKQLFIMLVKILGLFDKVLFHATTSDESNDVIRVFGEKTKVKVAGNLPQKLVKKIIPKRVKALNNVKLVNVARISPEKNLLYALQVLSKVTSKVSFDIYGPIYNQEYWSNCLQLIKSMPPSVTVNYKGSIDSKDVQKVLLENHFLFMPTTGENFGHIILQSLSSGCPVIISNQTPWKNLEEKKIGWDISLNSLESFIKVIEKCSIIQQYDFDVLSNSAFQFANDYSSNPLIVEENRQLFS